MRLCPLWRLAGKVWHSDHGTDWKLSYQNIIIIGRVLSSQHGTASVTDSPQLYIMAAHAEHVIIDMAMMNAAANIPAKMAPVHIKHSDSNLFYHTSLLIYDCWRRFKQRFKFFLHSGRVLCPVMRNDTLKLTVATRFKLMEAIKKPVKSGLNRPLNRWLRFRNLILTIIIWSFLLKLA